MDWPIAYGGDLRELADGAAAAYWWWPLLAWVVGVVALLVVAVLVTGRPVHRRFRCEQAGREVDVEFEEDGLPGCRRFVAVVSCSAFGPSTDVQCRRSCLDRDVASLEVRKPS